MFDLQTWITIGIGLLLFAASIIPYWIQYRRKESRARLKLLKTQGTELNTPAVMHPHIDALLCIGCGSCVKACPEGDVLGLIGGKAVLIHAAKCVGHALCAEDCPVGAITMQMGSPGRSAQLPVLDEYLQTNLTGLYIAGELGGIGLIKNAVQQGIRVVEHIAANTRPSKNGILDVVIVGAGPAGLAASLAAKAHELSFVLLEQGDIGGTILQYPRRKIVMTSPVELPLYGRIRLSETTKESLLELWKRILLKTDLAIQTNEKVLHISKESDCFHVKTVNSEYSGYNVILALGRRGTPRKLGVSGEELSKVTYRLIEAESYQNCRVLIVGGGDSAIEAAAALAVQKGNRVILSYRKGEFTRIKERNSKHLNELVKQKKIEVLFNSNVREILTDRVLIETQDGLQGYPNDYVFIFAGGELPYEFLRKIGIQFHSEHLQ
jgi:putative YpdA family bacillithiol system oxidoreductase